MDYDQLETLATAALSSPYQIDRDSAADSLRNLTSYDCFSYLQRAIVEIPDTSLYSCVILCKALKFVVLNELGPSERQSMQNLALDLVARKVNNQQFQSPPFILKSILSIYAAGLFLNFRLLLFGNKDAAIQGTLGTGLAADGGPQLGQKAMTQLSDRLGMERPDIIMMAITEVILHFNAEEKRNQTSSLRRAFATEILPTFFAYAVSQIHNNSTQQAAIELCVLCLELVPAGGSAPLVNISLHTDESLFLHPATAWLPPLRELGTFCANVVHDEYNNVGGAAGRGMGGAPSGSSTEYGPDSLLAISQQVLRSMSCAVFTDWRDGSSLLTLTDGFFKGLMPIAVAQMRTVANKMGEGAVLSRDDLSMLENAIAVAVNIFERNDLFVGSYVYNNVELFTTLAQVVVEFKSRMVMSGQLGENNILGKMMHLFYVVGERGVPPVPRCTSDFDPLNRGMIGDGGFDAAQQQQPTPAPVDETRRVIVNSILSVTMTYLEAIVETAHLAEDNYDLAREGFMLNLDNILTPMAEMVFSEVVDVVSIVDRQLSKTLEMHRMCVRIRSEVASRSASSGGASLDDGASIIESLIESQNDQDAAYELEFIGNSLFSASITSQAGLMLVTRVVLSRLAVLIALIGLAVKLRSGRSNGRLGSEDRLADQSLAVEVMNFISEFISPDHNITDMMLQCMTLLEEGNNGASGASMSTTSSGNNLQEQLHIPILRSFIYFCGCLHETWISRQPRFLEITSEMLSFALIGHGDCFALANDANMLVKRLLEEHTALTALSAVRHILEEHWNCNIMLTRNDFTPTDPEVRRLRSKTITNIVKLSEARADVQLQQFVPQMVNLLVVERDLELFIEDCTAVCEGVTYAVSLYSLVNMLVDQRETIVAGLTSLPDTILDRSRVFTKLVRMWSVLTGFCCRLLEADNTNECLWTLASFCFDSLFYSIRDLKTRFAPSIEAGRCLVPEQLLFDSCAIVVNTLKGKWCNVGVMLYYNDTTVLKSFGSVLELVVATPVQIIMSDFEKSPKVFAALYAALSTPSRPFIQGLRMFNVWSDLVPFLSKCLGYRFYDLTASCLLILLRDATVLIPSVTVSELCSTALVTLTTTQLGEHEVLDLCEMLIACHRREPERCENEFTTLLDVASAYHRVRVRSLLTMLRSGAQNAAAQYVEIFGTESNVVTVSGW